MTSSVAVTVGSAIDDVVPAFGRVPARDFDRIELILARAVAPAALASEVRERRPVPFVALFPLVELLPLAALPPPLRPLPL
jgi:hypothetical protein